MENPYNYLLFKEGEIMDNNNQDFEDMYSSQENESNKQSNIGRKAAKTKKMAKKATKYAKKGLTLAKNGAQKGIARAILMFLPYIAAIVAVILGIIFLIGVITFFITGPGNLMNQITQMIDEMGASIKKAYVSLTKGDDYAEITKQNVTDVAEYIEDMGYDLVGFGFVGYKQNLFTKVERENETIIRFSGDDVIKKVKISENRKQSIKEIQSNLLVEYIAAENRTYMLSTVSISSLYRWWKGVTILPKFTVGNSGEDKDEVGKKQNAENSEYGTGMIDIADTIDQIDTYEDVQQIKGFTEEETKLYKEAIAKLSGGSSNSGVGITPEVNRKDKTLILTINDVNNRIKTKCTYNLEGYAGRYGKPIVLFLALHLGTMAPGLAENVATSAAFDTKVRIRIHKTAEVVSLTYSYNGKDNTLDETEKILKKVENDVWNWMNQVNATARANGYSAPYTRDNAKREAESTVGITYNEINEAKKYEKEKTKVKYTPYISSVDYHWYKDVKFKDLDKATSDDAYIETYPTKTESKYNKFKVTTFKSGEIYQEKEPLRGQIDKNTGKVEDKVNPEFEKLFTKTWLKYTGNSILDVKSEEMKVENREESEITLGGDMKAVVTMLSDAAENKNSIDAKYVLRDLKEWLTKTKEIEFTDTKVLTDKNEKDDDENKDSSNGTSDNNKDVTVSDTKNGRLSTLVDGKTVGVIYTGNDVIVKTGELENGSKIKSPITGKITKVDDENVQIQITAPKKLSGKTMILSGMKMDSDIKEGNDISTGKSIGTSQAGTNITIKMQDENRASISTKEYINY